MGSEKLPKITFVIGKQIVYLLWFTLCSFPRWRERIRRWCSGIFLSSGDLPKIRRKKIKREKYAADQIWLPLNTVYKPFKRTESIYRSFRLRRRERKWQACFQCFLHLSATGVVARYLFHLSFFIAHRLWHHTLWQKVPPVSPVFWERSPNFPFHRWAPRHTCLFCGSPPRHSGWAGSTAAPGHGNRRRAHLWMVRLFPRPCIHPPKRREESQVKVSCLIEKGRVSYDERQTTAWMRWKSPRLCQCYCPQIKSLWCLAIHIIFDLLEISLNGILQKCP